MGQYDSGSDTISAGTIESLTALEATPEGQFKRWSDEISYAEKELKKYHEQARKTVKKYIDDRDAVEVNQKWLNLFRSNTNILKANLYAQIPGVDVSRKFFNMDDDVSRVAAIILQRSIEQDMTLPDCDFDTVMRHAIEDRLVPGLGTAWLRLETDTAPHPDPEMKLESGEPLEVITDQEVCVDYVFWEDFLWSPCRVWEERRWVARRVQMSRDALVKRFGEEMGKAIPLTTHKKTEQMDSLLPANIVIKQAVIYEIWDRQSKTVVWYCSKYDKLLDVRPDPLGLEHFEPCPKPMFANLTNSNCVPRPDYVMLQDQYSELDETNNRISLLVIACKVVGVYDRSSDGVQRMLNEGYDNILIPVDNWAMFAEKGGIKGQVDWLPLDQVIKALQQLQVHREAIKQQINELTGIADIVRGQTRASETLGAQELKSKYAAVQIQTLQEEVVRFAEEILQIKGEILVKHAAPFILVQMANITNPDDQAFIEPALALLKGNPEIMEWRIKVQADSMAMTDYVQQKTERTEFLNSVATFLQSGSTVGQGSPQLIPLMLQMLKFGVAGFRVSKDIEGTFDRYIKEFEDEIEAKKNAPPPPDPEMEKIKMEQAAKQQDAALKEQAAQADAVRKNQESQAKMVQDMMLARNELVLGQKEFQQQMMQNQQEFQQKLIQMFQEHQLKMDIAKEQSDAAIAAAKDKAAAVPKGDSNA